MYCCYKFAATFASDVGLCLLIDILHIIRPSFVVQLRLDAGRETKHLPDITPDFVANSRGLVYNQVIFLLLYDLSCHIFTFLSASLYFSKRGAY